MQDVLEVSSIKLLFMLMTLLLSMLFPIALWIFFSLRKMRVTAAVLSGSLGFIIPQMFIRIPILQVLAQNQAWALFCEGNALLSCAIYASTAALFETAGRVLVLRGLLHKSLSFNTALGAGLGHGGAESIGLIGFTYIGNIVLSFMINSGALEAAPELDQAINALVETEAGLFLLAGFERVFTLAFHMALTVLLCLFVMRKQLFAGALLVFAMHFSVDFFIPLLLLKGLDIWASEGIILLIAIGSVLLIAKLRPKFAVIESPKDPAAVALSEGY